MDAPLPGAIPIAAASFPLGTGLEADNIAPRAFVSLSMQALLALFVLLAAFEGKGSWC